MADEERHVARIITSGKLLLKILDFEGGIIWDIKPANEFGDVAILVEHPDLPLTKVYEQIPEVRPIYEATYGEDGTLIKVERTDPPKSNQQKFPPLDKI